MNAITMIRRCARYGTPEGWAEYGPPEPYEASTTIHVEEPMGNGETLSDPPATVSE